MTIPQGSPVVSHTTETAATGTKTFAARRARRFFSLGTRRLLTSVEVLVLTGAALLVTLPLLWAISTSLRTPAEAFNEPPSWVPTHPVWDNYSSVFQQVTFGTYLLNSLLITGSIIVCQLLTSSMAGYAFARLRFRGKSLLFWLILSTMMVPIQSTVIPVFILIKYLHLIDTQTSLILPAIGSAFGIFLMRQAFLRMPRDYGEAAMVDGASQWAIFAKIYIRMAGPTLATLAVLDFAGYWNEFFRPLIFLSSNSKLTVPIGLFNLQGSLGTGSISVVLAGVVIALIPNLVVFGFAQRYFVRGITFGGIKG